MVLRGDNMASVKRGNRSIILNLLHRGGEMSRKRLAEQMKLTPAAITLITGEMIAEGLLSEGDAQKAEGSSGRREIPLKIAYDAFIALGVTLNIGEAVLSATRLDGALVFSESVSFHGSDPVSETVAALSNKLFALTAANKLDRSRIIGLGIAMRGVVDVENARSVDSFGTFHEKNIPLCGLFEQETGLPVAMDNNVRSMFRAHIFFTDESYASQLFIRCERGIGGAVSAGGRLILGNRGRCAELGHTPMVEVGGKPCVCGKSGCLETISAAPAILGDVSAIYTAEATPLLYQYTGGHIENLTLASVFRAAEDGDFAVDAIVQNASAKLSSVLKTITYTLDPNGILLYGNMFEYAYFLKSLHTHFARGTELDPAQFVKKSCLNLTLEDKAACIIAIEAFFADGGLTD